MLNASLAILKKMNVSLIIPFCLRKVKRHFPYIVKELHCIKSLMLCKNTKSMVQLVTLIS